MDLCANKFDIKWTISLTNATKQISEQTKFQQSYIIFLVNPLFKNLKKFGPDAFTVEFLQTFKEEITLIF